MLLWRGTDHRAMTFPTGRSPLDLVTMYTHFGSAAKQAARRSTAHLLLWARDPLPPECIPAGWQELRDVPPPPAVLATLRLAPADMKTRCRTGLLYMHRLGWPGDVCQQVAEAFQLAWLRHHD